MVLNTLAQSGITCPDSHARKVAPGRPELAEQYPEDAIRVPQSGRLIGAKGGLELVAENEVF